MGIAASNHQLENKDKILKHIEKNNPGTSVSIHFRSEEDEDDSDGTNSVLKINLSNEDITQITIHSDIYPDDEVYFIQLINNKLFNYGNNATLLYLMYNKDCIFDKATQWVYENNYLHKRLWYNQEGKIFREKYVNRKWLSLQEIYKDQSKVKFPTHILKTASRKDRVIVSVFDSGIDYNHPKLAYKIHDRPITLHRHNEMLEKQAKLFSEKFQIIEENGESKYLSVLDEKLKNVSLGWDFDQNDPEPYDFSTSLNPYWYPIHHGTAVSGILVENTDDISIIPVRLTDNINDLYLEAIDYIYNKGSRIVSMSICSNYEENFRSIVTALKKYPDLLLIACAGNEGGGLKMVRSNNVQDLLRFLLALNPVRMCKTS